MIRASKLGIYRIRLNTDAERNQFASLVHSLKLKHSVACETSTGDACIWVSHPTTFVYHREKFPCNFRDLALNELNKFFSEV